jgi:hypothetical protein
MAELERLNIPVTPETLASSWAVGSGGTQAIVKAVKEGRGKESIGKIMSEAGYPTNLANNPWMSQSANEFLNRQQQKIETTRKKIENKETVKTPKDKTSSLVIPDFNQNVAGIRDASKIDIASFDLSIREVESETPYVIINNNMNQQTVVINKKQGRSVDPLKKMKTEVV